MIGTELVAAEERERLTALVGAIERARASYGAPRPASLRGTRLAERPLSHARVAAAARAVLDVLADAGAIERAGAVSLARRFADADAVERLVSWGGGRAASRPFPEADRAWAVLRLALPAFLRGAEGAPADPTSGTCPECGGAPDLAFVARGGARELACGTCDTIWRYDRVHCPFCANAEQDKLAYLVGGPRGLSIRVCEGCRAYLKTVDRRALPGDEPPLLLRLLTVEMDLAAHEAGYGGCPLVRGS